MKYKKQEWSNQMGGELWKRFWKGHCW